MLQALYSDAVDRWSSLGLLDVRRDVREAIMSRDVECMMEVHGWRIVVEAIELDATILNVTEQPELTPRWWRDESDRYRVRSSPPMMVKIYECGHAIKTDVPAVHEINRAVPLRPLGKCEACRTGKAWDIEVLQGTPALLEIQRSIDRLTDRYKVWSNPGSDPIADIRAGIKAAANSRTNPPPQWERSVLAGRIRPPTCALCREEVTEFSVLYDARKRRHVFNVWCHGRNEYTFVTDQQLVTADRGTVRVWDQVVW